MIAYFYHKTTGLPLVGGTVKMTLVNANSNSIVVNAGAMSEVTNLPGAYYHPYLADLNIDYIGQYTCTDSNYVSSIDKIYLQASRTSVWSYSNKNDFGAIDRDNIEKIKKIVDTLKDLIESTKKEIMNQEEKEIDFSSIIDKIDSIEIPEMEKIDLSPVTKKIDSFSKDINEIKKMVKYDYSKDIEEAVKEKESEMNDQFEKTKEEIFTDANEVIRLLEEENIQVKDSLKNKIISSLSE